MKIQSWLLLGCLLLPLQFAVAADTNSDPAAASSVATEADGFSGKVIETTNAANYTYVLVDTGSKKLWAVTTPVRGQSGR